MSTEHFFTNTGIRCSPGSYPIQKMWDRDRKIAIDNYGIKGKPTGYIYLPGLKYPEAKVHLELRSGLKGSVINYAPKIGKYVNKHRLYRQCLPIRAKDTKVTEIENTLSVRSVMNVTPLFYI